VSTWLQHTAGSLVSNLDVLRKQMVTSIARLASTSASQETNRVPQKLNTAEVNDRVANGLSIRMGQLRASSEIAISGLRSEIERLNGSVERNQRELLAKLDQLQERLERLENQSAGASSTKQVQPLEKPAAAKPAPLPLQPSAPAIAAGAPKPTTPPAQIKRIENWEVMEVVDGTAILAGPRGMIEVSSGDVVPGIGRVDSISRRGRRWVVATSKGMIMSR
jgi:TolA-binding protein